MQDMNIHFLDIKGANTMETFCIPANAQALQRASDLLRQGQVVAFPTETVYGLGASALDENAVRPKRFTVWAETAWIRWPHPKYTQPRDVLRTIP